MKIIKSTARKTKAAFTGLFNSETEPGNLWYGYQYTKAIANNYKDVKKKANRLLINSGVTTVSGSIALTLAYSALINPLTTLFTGGMGLVAAAGVGGVSYLFSKTTRKAWRNIKKDGTIYMAIDEAKRKWENKRHAYDEDKTPRMTVKEAASASVRHSIGLVLSIIGLTATVGVIAGLAGVGLGGAIVAGAAATGKTAMLLTAITTATEAIGIPALMAAGALGAKALGGFAAQQLMIGGGIAALTGLITTIGSKKIMKFAHNHTLAKNGIYQGLAKGTGAVTGLFGRKKDVEAANDAQHDAENNFENDADLEADAPTEEPAEEEIKADAELAISAIDMTGQNHIADSIRTSFAANENMGTTAPQTPTGILQRFKK